MPAPTNRPTLESVRALPVGEIAALPADLLALLQHEAATALKAAKTVADWLDGAIALRFSDRARQLRREAGKDTGSVRFEEDGVGIEADLPKRIDWDQRHLAALVDRIRAEGDDPLEYVEISIKVAERKYAAWPNHIRSKFEPARTVRTGKESIALTLAEDVR